MGKDNPKLYSFSDTEIKLGLTGLIQLLPINWPFNAVKASVFFIFSKYANKLF